MRAFLAILVCLAAIAYGASRIVANVHAHIAAHAVTLADGAQ